MPRPIKVYFHTASSLGLDARHRDGRRAAQIYKVVRCRTKKRAMELLGIGPYEFNLYVSEVPNHRDIDDFPEDVVYVKPLDLGGTIRGLQEWQPLVEVPQPTDGTTPN